MNLCLCRKPRWLNSIAIPSVPHARNLGLILDNFLSLPPYILYITGLIDLTFKMDLDSFQGSLFPLSAFWSWLRPWSSHTRHGSWNHFLITLRTVSLDPALQSIFYIAVMTVFFKSWNLTTWFLCLNLFNDFPLLLK